MQYNILPIKKHPYKEINTVNEIKKNHFKFSHIIFLLIFLFIKYFFLRKMHIFLSDLILLPKQII